MLSLTSCLRLLSGENIRLAVFESVFPASVKGKYELMCRDSQGKVELRTLEEII